MSEFFAVLLGSLIAVAITELWKQWVPEIPNPALLIELVKIRIKFKGPTYEHYYHIRENFWQIDRDKNFAEFLGLHAREGRGLGSSSRSVEYLRK